MRKLIIAGVVGIGVLTAGSMLLIAQGDRDAGPGARPVVPPPPPAPEPVAPPDDGSARSVVLPDGQAAAAAATAASRGSAPASAPTPAPPGSWEAAPLASSGRRAGDPAVAAVGRKQKEITRELKRCLDPKIAAEAGAATYARAQRQEAEDDQGSTVLVLYLESQAGSVRVVDAPVERSGGASDGTLACMQASLRGKVLPAPGAKPGQRQRLQFRVRT